jgi:hypothetical protein
MFELAGEQVPLLSAAAIARAGLDVKPPPERGSVDSTSSARALQISAWRCWFSTLVSAFNTVGWC